MNPPHVRTTAHDPRSRVAYHVLAYRQLARDEVLECVRWFLSRARGRRRAKPGDLVEIHTIIGCDE